MRKISFICLLLVFLSFFLFGVKQTSFAADCTARYSPTEIFENTEITITVENTTKSQNYFVYLSNESRSKNYYQDKQTSTEDGQVLTFTIPAQNPGTYELLVTPLVTGQKLCLQTLIPIKPKQQSSSCNAWIGDNPASTPVLSRGSTTTLHAVGTEIGFNQNYKINISGDSGSYDSGYTISQTNNGPELTFLITTNKKDGQPLLDGTHGVTIFKNGNWICLTSYAINIAGAPPQNTPTQPPAPPPPCAKLDNGKCTEVDTGLGIPIKTEPADFIKSIFGILLGLSGGIALLLIIASGYRLMASQGNPEKLQGAKEMLTSAIVGLLFIIFSFVILEVIGVDILKIPGLGE